VLGSHLVYFCIDLAFRQVPDCINDVINKDSQRGAILTHCRRELMQEVWNTLLDGDFMAAYKHGFVIQCHDGQSRRFYPRLFTYSADYPEK